MSATKSFLAWGNSAGGIYHLSFSIFHLVI
jgi:hypothetical protein